MKSHIYCLSEPSFTSQLIEIECQSGRGLPITTIIGTPGRSVSESRDRIRAAFQACAIPYPRKRLTINLAPADIPKRGGGFDLAIAAAILQTNGLVPARSLPVAAGYIGELGLDGSLKPVAGIVGRLVSAQRAGLDLFFIPIANMEQACLVPGIRLIAINDLKHFYEGCHGLVDMSAHDTGDTIAIPPGQFRETRFSTVVGQPVAKRALTIAAAGGHNLLLNGRPGAGKSMLGRCLVELLPPMSQLEQLMVTHTTSLVTNTRAIAYDRPIITPHHTVGPVALIGKTGAVNQASGGVLLLDELPEFSRAAIEALRQPLETNRSPHCQFVATANPCPCGFYGHETIECRCAPYNIQRYRQKLSGPLIDRIDLFVTVDDIDHRQLLEQPSENQLDSLRTAVLTARHHQRQRYGDDAILNATCPDKLLKQTCQLSIPARAMLDEAASKLNVSARNYMRCLRIARSLADLADQITITPEHVAEALHFRPQQSGIA